MSTDKAVLYGLLFGLSIWLRPEALMATLPVAAVEERASQKAFIAAEELKRSASVSEPTPPAKEEASFNNVTTTTHVRVDLSRDGPLWMPG